LSAFGLGQKKINNILNQDETPKPQNPKTPAQFE